MPVTGGSLAEREAHAATLATQQAELFMSPTCTVEQLKTWANMEAMSSPNWVAYELTANGGAWWVGHMAFVEQRWSEVAQSVGMDGESFRPMRPMFYDAFYERCAAFVRAHFKLPEPTP